MASQALVTATLISCPNANHHSATALASSLLPRYPRHSPHASAGKALHHNTCVRAAFSLGPFLTPTYNLFPRRGISSLLPALFFAAGLLTVRCVLLARIALCLQTGV